MIPHFMTSSISPDDFLLSFQMPIFLQEVIFLMEAFFPVLHFEKSSTLTQISPIKLALGEALHRIFVIYHLWMVYF